MTGGGRGDVRGGLVAGPEVPDDDVGLRVGGLGWEGTDPGLGKLRLQPARQRVQSERVPSDQGHRARAPHPLSIGSERGAGATL